MPQHLIQNQSNRSKQGGATLLGMLIVGAMIVFVALIIMKMVPAYTEFFSLKKVLVAMDQEPLNEMSKKDIITAFNKKASTAYIDSVSGADLLVEKNVAGDTVVSVEYQVIKPIMGNVSVLIDFSASSDGK